jgi:hypothetical protein
MTTTDSEPPSELFVLFARWSVPAGLALLVLAGYANSLGWWGFQYPDLTRRLIIAAFSTLVLIMTIAWLVNVTFAKNPRKQRTLNPDRVVHLVGWWAAAGAIGITSVFALANAVGVWGAPRDLASSIAIGMLGLWMGITFVAWMSRWQPSEKALGRIYTGMIIVSILAIMLLGAHALGYLKWIP